jgi:hypothetical protein
MTRHHQVRSPLRRCAKCAALIVWHQDPASSRWVPLNASDRTDHRKSCIALPSASVFASAGPNAGPDASATSVATGHPARIKDAMTKMIEEARAANRAEQIP